MCSKSAAESRLWVAEPPRPLWVAASVSAAGSAAAALVKSSSIIVISLVLPAGHFQARTHADGMEYQFGNFLVVVIARRRPGISDSSDGLRTLAIRKGRVVEQGKVARAPRRSGSGRQEMRFGIFDHLDDSGVPVGQLFEERLKLIEAYDRAGFYGYHLAEHHNTPLGYAPSPGVFLSAVAQRTRQLRFGPMVYLLPLYHPLRLIDEICMLDQMSGGRFLFGVGRGVSPVEVGFFGVDFARGMQQFREAYECIRRGLSEDRLTFHGEFYDFDNIPIVMKPVQQPYPSLWYGVGRPESIPWAAANAANIVARRPPAQVRAIVHRYRAEWRALGRSEAELPLMGVNRHIILADTEGEALDVARRGYPAWRHHMGLP